MTQSNASLRRALMEANLNQYRPVLETADAAGADFSPDYLRERMRLLADPWGWMRRWEARSPRRRRRLNWRIAVIAAALLLLSACGYALVTGQFSQWFPRLEVDPKAPEISEGVLSRTGTAIEQSQTVDGVTATLNAAVWDGSYLHMSLTVTAPDIPEEVAAETNLYTEECSFLLSEKNWKKYVWKDEASFFDGVGDDSQELLERSVQNRMDLGQAGYWNHVCLLSFHLIDRTENTLTFETFMAFKDYLEQPEITLRLKNIATYVDGKGAVTWHDSERTGPGPDVTFLRGPMDFTFTLGEPIRPIHYQGTVPATVDGIPFRFTGFEISVFDMDVDFEVSSPVEYVRPEEYDELKPLNPDTLYDKDVSKALFNVIQGLWTEDGGYVDLSNRGGGRGMSTSLEGVCGGDVGVSYPHPIDPATITAVKLNGTRVELSELERLTE